MPYFILQRRQECTQRNEYCNDFKKDIKKQYCDSTTQKFLSFDEICSHYSEKIKTLSSMSSLKNLYNGYSNRTRVYYAKVGSKIENVTLDH